ncbi:Exocyst complex component EXO70A1 [Vitis vinifera]|uniref:Exocyst subunit Exo70 family protein n=1 Tax=Vitis vinifera TaxID=29760 RepID=A0A438F856_VITVI|nr:Exocyst complex component EXO70A1 [Vitis vinifera]
MEPKEEDPTLAKLQSACSDLKKLLHSSASMEASLEKMDKNFDTLQETLSTASRRVGPLQSLAIASKALDTRINRAVSPALALLESFKLAESLQHKLLQLTSELSSKDAPKKRLKALVKYVDCVDKLNAAINSISLECEPAIQKLQEVVEFLSRTRATDQYRTHRLRETLITLKALYETEVDAMRFDGLLDEALLNLQDEYERILQQLRHRNIAELQGDVPAEMMASDLGTELEVEVLRRISETLATNDCLDICIDIFVKVRYRRAAKALMRLNPDYLRTYTPEEIDNMEWESLETATALWIQHFELAVKTVLVSEKKLCKQVLSGIMEGLIWTECFVKIADKIMAVFFRFGEGVARSNKEPQKLFKLLDMFDSLEKLKTQFSEIFEGEAGADICLRFRELTKLLVHSSSKVFWEFGLQIEGNQDGFPPLQDGSVPKLVRYAINYLKYLTTENYSAPMAKRNGSYSEERGVEKIPMPRQNSFHVFAMNTYWYIYMRSRSSELGKLLGEQWMKKKYKIIAEESAYMYQKQAWGTLVNLLEKEESNRQTNKESMGAVIRGKMEAFLEGLDEISKRHRTSYTIPDADLRIQLREASVKLVVTAYTEFLTSYSYFLQPKSYLPPDSIQAMLGQLFNDGHRVPTRLSKDRMAGDNSAGEIKDFSRSRSNASDQ